MTHKQQPKSKNAKKHIQKQKHTFTQTYTHQTFIKFQFSICKWMRNKKNDFMSVCAEYCVLHSV